MSFYLIPSLVAFRDEINNAFPHRDKASDGWIGDTSHAARKSSHNPDWAHGGAVRAIDVDIDDNDPNQDLRAMVIAAAKGDHRVWYIISNGVIYSRTHGWRALRYTGSNGHFKHVHISAVENPALWTDTSPWMKPIWRPNFDVKASYPWVHDQILIGAQKMKGQVRRSNGVGFIQNALNVKTNTRLIVDGFAGLATAEALVKAGVGPWISPKDLEKLQIKYRFKNLP